VLLCQPDRHLRERPRHHTAWGRVVQLAQHKGVHERYSLRSHGERELEKRSHATRAPRQRKFSIPEDGVCPSWNVVSELNHPSGECASVFGVPENALSLEMFGPSENGFPRESQKAAARNCRTPHKNRNLENPQEWLPSALPMFFRRLLPWGWKDNRCGSLSVLCGRFRRV
jgi:hypothetical protein